jgi:thioredoxin reductase
MGRDADVAIIGGGPYGLSVSAHLTVYGIDHRIFGVPLQLWRGMPKGMCLKSHDFATNIYSPRKGFSFIDYCRMNGVSSAEPIAIDLFIRYGLWAQEQLVPQLEQVNVTRLSKNNGKFELELVTGEKFKAKRVVMATGLTNFARMPEVLKKLPKNLASHTSDHDDYAEYRGKEVLVVGAGQSALEAAVILHENGAKVQLVVRNYAAYCASAPQPVNGIVNRIRNPLSVLGHGRLNFFLDRVPLGAYYLPDERRIKLTRTHLGPIGAWWLAPRFEGKIPILPRTEIVKAEPRGGRIAVWLRNLSGGEALEMVVDHVVSGTGYEPDIDRLDFIEPGLARQIERIERAPRLKPSFESTVPGMYFIGAAAAFSHGPLFRFVAGADFSSATVSNALKRDLGKGSGSRLRVASLGAEAP